MAWSKEDIESTFTIILDRVSNGMSIRETLRLDDMPCRKTFYKWIDKDETKRNQYAYACEERADHIFEDILHIADDATHDVVVTEFGESANTEFIQRSKVRIDARKWMLSKMQPKKYSDKIQVDTTEFSEQPLFPDVSKDNSDK